jgi:hypothetical protein
MIKRSSKSESVKDFVGLYKSMTNDQLEDEFHALSDQILAYLIASDCRSIEVLYDYNNSLYVEFNDLDIKNEMLN